MPPTSSSPRWSWASRVGVLALLVAGTLPAPARSELVERPRHRWDLGADLIFVWGGALRLGYEHDEGLVDMVGLRAGWVVGPSPVFGDERALAAAFVAPVVDLFADQEWQLELTAGPARIEVDHRGEALLGLDRWGFVSGMAGRYKTPGWFQINIGLLMISDHRFYERVVVVDIGPSAVW